MTSAPVMLHTEPAAESSESPEVLKVPPLDQSVQIIVRDGQAYGIVPNTLVTFHEVNLPTRSDAQARVAAPFALEDDVAVDISLVHVAIGPETEHGLRVAVVVAHGDMKLWADELVGLRVQPVALVPEACAIEVSDHVLAIIDRADGIALVSRRLRAVVEENLFDVVVSDAIANSGVELIQVYSDRPHSLLSKSDFSHLRVEYLPAVSEEEYEEWLASGVVSAPVNLLQGVYSSRIPLLKALASWKAPISLAVTLAILFLSFVLSEAVHLNRQTEQVYSQTEEVFRAAMPDVRRMVNPQLQLQARLNESGGQGGNNFLTIAAALTESLSEAGAGQIEMMQFNAAKQSLNATLSLQTYSDIEAIRKLIAERGLVFEEGGTQTADQQVISDIVVRLP